MKFHLFSLFILNSTSAAYSISETNNKNVRLNLSTASVDNSTTADSTTSTSIMSESSSFFSSIPFAPPDSILGIAENFQKCTSPSKVNICVGAYRDENGKPWILPSVREAEKKMMDSPTENKEYANIAGDAKFVSLAVQFAYGKDADLDKIAAVQTLSGTGACCIGGHFLSRFLPALPDGSKKIYIPTPTWGNHINIYKVCGLDVQRYRYYDPRTNGLDMNGMVEDLRNAPEGSVVLLHACAHNPTGCDPSHEQWKQLSDLCHEKKFCVFFDSAYQGFASGDAEADAYALRLFVKEGHNIILAQSFAKNFGLYGERCGTLSVVTNSKEEKDVVFSQLKAIIRPMYSSPPIHGSSIVRTVLSDDTLRDQYYQECSFMADRIGSMRTLLVSKLKEAGSTHDWSHVTSQIGMFAYTGMSTEMCEILTEKFFIFLTKDGRISLAGLNEKNVEYVAKAIHEVTDGKSITAE